MNPLAQIGGERKVIAPRSIDLEQHHRPLGALDGVLAGLVDQRAPALGRTLPDLRRLLTVKDRLPGVHDVAALPFDGRRVAPERLPNLEVLPFDDALRAGDLAAQHGMVERFVALAGHDATRDERLDAVPHQQIIFEAHEETRLARIALPSGAAPELKIHTTAFVTIRPDHIEAAERRDLVVFRLVLAPQPDVGAPAGHVRGDGDGAKRPGARDQTRFHRIVLRVQNLARHAGVAKPRREAFRLFDGERPDEHGPSGRMGALDLFDHGPLFGVPMGEDDVRVIDADHRAVSRHDDHVEPVQVTQFQRGGLGRAGHAAQTLITLHEMLQRNRAQDPPVGLPLDAFLRLERRLQTIGPVTIGDDPARELVDDPDAALAHDVVDVSPQEHLRMERAIELGQHAVVLRIVEAADAKRALDLFDPGLGQLDVTAVFVGVEVDARRERGHERGQPRRGRDLATDTAGDDQRHARLVDEERVGFVHEREMERPVNELPDDPWPADRADDRIPPLWRSHR